jgi:hypothetical protein
MNDSTKFPFSLGDLSGSCTATWRNYSTSSSPPPITLESIKSLIDSLPAMPPARQFVENGLVHAIFDGHSMRVSADWFAKIKARCVHGDNLLGSFNSMPLILDDDLPREPDIPLARVLEQCSISLVDQS